MYVALVLHGDGFCGDGEAALRERYGTGVFWASDEPETLSIIKAMLMANPPMGESSLRAYAQVWTDLLEVPESYAEFKQIMVPVYCTQCLDQGVVPRGSQDPGQCPRCGRWRIIIWDEVWGGVDFLWKDPRSIRVR